MTTKKQDLFYGCTWSYWGYWGDLWYIRGCPSSHLCQKYVPFDVWKGWGQILSLSNPLGPNFRPWACFVVMIWSPPLAIYKRGKQCHKNQFGKVVTCSRLLNFCSDCQLYASSHVFWCFNVPRVKSNLMNNLITKKWPRSVSAFMSRDISLTLMYFNVIVLPCFFAWLAKLYLFTASFSFPLDGLMCSQKVHRELQIKTHFVNHQVTF